MTGRDAPSSWRRFLRLTGDTVERLRCLARRTPRLRVFDAEHVDIIHPSTPPEMRSVYRKGNA